MLYILPILLLIGELAVPSLAYEAPDFPGDYCRSNNKCCLGREDACSHRISDTVCYCDVYCEGDNRLNKRDDCCPDYISTCKHIDPTPTTESPPTEAPTNQSSTTEAPTTQTTPPRVTPPPDTQIRGCSNTCDNELDSASCDEIRCIIDDQIISQVNRNSTLGWRASNYSQFENKTLNDGLVYKLGTLINPLIYHAVALKYGKNVAFDKTYDSRLRWPEYISPVADQRWCGSDWAVSVATIVSDRFAIQLKEENSVPLSAQSLLSCNAGSSCKGGYIDRAWRFANIYGLVEERCFTYKENKTDCPYNTTPRNWDSVGCDSKAKLKVEPVMRLVTEEDIMYDILINGPVQAVMTVHQDFFHYQEGIYRRSTYGDQDKKGHHSVRILGWGEENDQKYWIVANSWGTAWGENGYFRIARGRNEANIESLVLTAACDLYFEY